MISMNYQRIFRRYISIRTFSWWLWPPSKRWPAFLRLEYLMRWADEEPNLVVPDLSTSLGFGSGLKPWDGGPLWSFDTWIISMEVIPRFLVLGPLATEDEFLQSLNS